MSIDPSLVAVAAVSGIVGALVTAGINAWGQHKQRQLELVKHQRELVFKTAFEHWKEHSKITAQHKGYIEPFDLSVIHMVALAEAAFSGPLTAENLKQRLEDSSKIVHAAQDYYLSIKPVRRDPAAR